MASAPAPRLARNLGLGSSGDDVRSLQALLNSSGFAVAASGPGSPGLETGFFGPATRAAVARLQAARGIPATGLFGPLTRAAVGR
jgi:peptidoglycan hydrolase-like protein with peptidoglycan-binding domain